MTPAIIGQRIQVITIVINTCKLVLEPVYKFQPIIAPTILLFLLLTTIGTLGSFGLVFFLTAGGPARSTELISIYIYLESFYQYQLGYGAAVGMITLAISVILGIVYLKFLKVKV